jgi:hypothetical protein
VTSAQLFVAACWFLLAVSDKHPAHSIWPACFLLQVRSRAGRHQDAFLDLHSLRAVAPDTPGLLDMLRAAAAGCLEQQSNGDNKVTKYCALLISVLRSISLSSDSDPVFVSLCRSCTIGNVHTLAVTSRVVYDRHALVAPRKSGTT